MRGFRVLAVFLAASLAALAVGQLGCAEETTTTTASTTETTVAPVPFNFGLAGPMTGQYANYGASLTAGVDIAVEELNALGGVNGGEASYVSGDDLGESGEAAVVAQKFADDAGVLFVSGHMFSGAVVAAGAKYEQSGLPMISPSATNPEISTLGDFIWRICMTDAVQGEGLAKYTIDDLGIKKVAIMYDDGAYGRGLAEAYEAAVKAAGGEVVGRESYTAGDAEFKAQLDKIKQAAPELVLLSGYYTDGAVIVQQAAESGIQVTWLGSDGFATNDLVTLGGVAVEGVLASTFFDPAKNDPAVQGFVEAYRAKHDGANPDWFAASSYDVVMLAAAAAKAAGSNDRAAINGALGSMGTYQGITGAFTFDKNGDATRSLNIVVVKGGALVTAPVQPSARAD